MSMYQMTLEKYDWYGADGGYGCNSETEVVPMEFNDDKEALAWAYGYVQKSQTKGGRSTAKKMLEVHFDSDNLTDDDGKPVRYAVQYLFSYRAWYVFTRFKHDPYVRGFRLHKDGTMGRWNGIY